MLSGREERKCQRNLCTILERKRPKAKDENLLGGKGANLAEMVKIEFPSPGVHYLCRSLQVTTTSMVINIRKALRMK